MPRSSQQPIYDPSRTYDDNFDHGPFGGFVSPQVFEGKGEPQHSFLGFPIYTPFGIPAGPLLNASYVIPALAKGFDVVTYKTQRSVPFEVNAFPNVLYVDIDGDLTLAKAAQPLVGRPTTGRPPSQITITNSFAVPSRGPDFWRPDFIKAQAAAGPGQLVIMSVQGTIQPGFTGGDYYEDFATVTKMAVDAGAKVIELNLSCPNVAGEGVICYSPKAVEEICRRAKAAAGSVPLLTKIGYYAPDQQELLETIVTKMAPYIAGIASINTIAAAVVDDHGQQALPGEGRLKSGLCGASIKWAGLEMVSRLTELRTKLGLKYEIIGVGGVMTPADYHEYRKAGADVVQSATGAMWDPELAIKIKSSS